MGQPLCSATGPRHGPAAASCGRQRLAIIIHRLSSLVPHLVLLPARDEAPHTATSALGADEQVARRSLHVVAADVAAEGRLTTHPPEGRDAGHAVDRSGVLAARSRDIRLLAVEVRQDLIDTPERLFVHALPPDRLRSAISPLTKIACTIRRNHVKSTTSHHTT